MANILSIVRIRPNPEKAGDERKKLLHKDHHSFIEGLSAKNKILVGGPIMGKPGGMLVVDLPREECELLLSQDPMVEAGYLMVEVSEWKITHNPENLLRMRQRTQR